MEKLLERILLVALASVCGLATAAETQPTTQPAGGQKDFGETLKDVITVPADILIGVPKVLMKIIDAPQEAIIQPRPTSTGLYQYDPAEIAYELQDREATREVVENKWFKWGFDFRAREVYHKNATYLDSHRPNSEYQFQRYRSRIWSTITPLEGVDINSRLTWEFRHYCEPHSVNSDPDSEAVIDTLNVTFNKPAGAPFKFIMGRQDIFVGDGWLIADGTPLDGSRTYYFDAFRLQYFLDKDNDVDVMYLNTPANGDQYITPFNTQHTYLVEQNMQGVVAMLNNKSWAPGSTISPYVIWSKDNKVLSNGYNADLYTFGARASGNFRGNWFYRAEGAMQLGRKDGQAVVAGGLNSLLEYRFLDGWQNAIGLGYEFLSGDDPDSSTNGQFDPLWGRWPRFSELLIYTFAGETHLAEATNMHRLSIGWTARPHKNIELFSTYQLLFAAENTFRDKPGFSADGKFRGQLVTAVLKYKFNENISGHLLGEAFFPGDYYDDSRNDPAFFARYQLVFEW